MSQLTCRFSDDIHCVSNVNIDFVQSRLHDKLLWNLQQNSCFREQESLHPSSWKYTDCLCSVVTMAYVYVRILCRLLKVGRQILLPLTEAKRVSQMECSCVIFPSLIVWSRQIQRGKSSEIWSCAVISGGQVVDTLDMMPYHNKLLCQPIHGILNNERYWWCFANTPISSL